MSRLAPWQRRLLLAFLALGLIAAAVWALNRRDEAPIDPARTVAASPELIARGAYLARARCGR